MSDPKRIILLSDGAGVPPLHWPTRLGTIKRLNLAFLIDRQDNGLVGWIDIEADDLVQFGRKLGIVDSLNRRTRCGWSHAHAISAVPN
jgi:hypothetical protein